MVKWLKLALCVSALGLGPGCSEDQGTVVALTLEKGFEIQAEATHYELFATVGQGAVSLLKFELRDLGAGRPKEVVDHFAPNVVYGITDEFDFLFYRPVGGVRFRTPVNLTGATELFITSEQNGDTDPAPSREVKMACTLGPGGAGTLACELRPRDKDLVLGTAALVLPSHGVHGF